MPLELKVELPRWMVVPRKPHPFKNEYHTICCAEAGIMYQLELVEGKDCPRELGPKKYNSYKGKTVGLMCCMTVPIHHMGKVVIMDSGFGVLKGLLELKKLGVYGLVVIKKCCYWPKDIDSEEIKDHMELTEVGRLDTLMGTKEGQSFYVFAMKEPDYIIMLISTYGTLAGAEDGKTKWSYKDKFGKQFNT